MQKMPCHYFPRLATYHNICSTTELFQLFNKEDKLGSVCYYEESCFFYKFAFGSSTKLHYTTLKDNFNKLARLSTRKNPIKFGF